MSKWIGYAVSVNCGEPLGCYQGTILEADGTTITLTKAFRNGFPYPKSQVTLNAADIKDLKIIESKPEPAEQPRSTVAVAKGGKKGNRATVCENLQANKNTGVAGGGPTVSGHVRQSPPAPAATSAAPAPRSQPIDIQGTRSNKNNQPGSFGNAGSTPKGRGGGGGGGGAARRKNEKNEACFGASASPALHDDFDFEGNLALFDKRALWEQMRGARPDLLPPAPPDRFRHDEDVLGARVHPARPALCVPDELRGAHEYVTDAGARVPSVQARVRRQLWRSLRRLDLLEFSNALLARAAADVALRLVGGGRRLEPRNAHQAPRVVALVGAHGAGAAGLACARVLASHGARATALVSGAAGAGAAGGTALARELAAAALGEVSLVSEVRALPSPDLVVVALYDPLEDSGQEAHEAALRWAASSRAALVALEPPPSGWEGLCARAAVLGLVPPALPAALGRVYLADVAPPLRVFTDLGIEYRPPFGASSLLALHPADPAEP